MNELLQQDDNGVLTLSLNRPSRINSFTRALHRELRSALEFAESSPAVRVVVIKGEGRGFCAGQDLSDLSLDPKAPTDLGLLVADYFNPLILQIAQMSKPVLSQVHGIAAGAGASLALACDLTIASDDASFLQAFVNIGLIPDSGGTWFLPHLAGQQRAMGLALLGEKLSATQALQFGLIWQTAPAAELDQRVKTIADRLAKLPPRALAGIKKTIRLASNQSLADQLQLEAQIQADLGRSPDYFEGVDAFLNKRSAQFTGA